MRIERADATVSLPWSPGSMALVVTSPPFWGIRNYGPDWGPELGMVEPLSVYLHRLVGSFRLVRETLDDAGVLVVNISDTASKSGGAGGDYNSGGSKEGRPKWKQGDSGLAAKTWCGVPQRFAAMMLADGWLLRSEIIWDKGVERAESLTHVQRVRPAHEQIYVFAKGPKHRWFPDGLVESGSVWHFPPERSGAKGQAPFPDELPARVIAIYSEPGDNVGDNYCGSGTTVRVADAMGRVGWGVDLYAEEAPCPIP